MPFKLLENVQQPRDEIRKVIKTYFDKNKIQYEIELDEKGGRIRTEKRGLGASFLAAIFGQAGSTGISRATQLFNTLSDCKDAKAVITATLTAFKHEIDKKTLWIDCMTALDNLYKIVDDVRDQRAIYEIQLELCPKGPTRKTIDTYKQEAKIRLIEKKLWEATGKNEILKPAAPGGSGPA